MPDYNKTVVLGDYPNLAAALAALAPISEGGTLVVDQPYALIPNDPSEIPRTVVLQFTGTGAFSVLSTRKLVVQGEIVEAGRVVRFTGPGDVFLPGAVAVFPEWFGAVQGGITDCAPPSVGPSRPWAASTRSPRAWAPRSRSSR